MWCKIASFSSQDLASIHYKSVNSATLYLAIFLNVPLCPLALVPLQGGIVGQDVKTVIFQLIAFSLEVHKKMILKKNIRSGLMARSFWSPITYYNLLHCRLRASVATSFQSIISKAHLSTFDLLTPYFIKPSSQNQVSSLVHSPLFSVSIILSLP